MFQNYRLIINKKFSWYGILYVKENIIIIKDCDVKFFYLKFFLIYRYFYFSLVDCQDSMLLNQVYIFFGYKLSLNFMLFY